MSFISQKGIMQGLGVKSPHVLYRWCSLHGEILRKVKVLA